MDKKQIREKLKKYLFFVSIVFFFASGSHLIYKYIYSDSKEIPQKGGSISESFVGQIPNLNPLKLNNPTNEYINHILYRSLLTFDINKNEFVGDLAKNCDLENLSNIKCFLSDNIKWSNGDDITTQDILATYNIIKETNSNPILGKILKNMDIKAENNIITFKSTKKDINNIKVLFQEIVPKKIIDSLDKDNIKGNFSSIDGIYSGYYKIARISQEQNSSLTKFILEKNDLYINNPVYINNIILKFYKNYNSLLKQKDNITIFADDKKLIGDSLPKLKNYKYNLKRYVGIFINKDNLIYPNIRNFILYNINSKEIVNKIGTNNVKEINAPFLDNIEINSIKKYSSLKQLLNSIGYYKKDKWLSFFKNNTYSQEAQINNLEKDKKEIDITKIKNSITKDNYNKDSKIIFEPNRVDLYNYITNPNIILKGKIIDPNITNIYINDKKVKNINLKNKEFSFKLDNIKIGKNSYKIYFEQENGKKQLKEELIFFYRKNKELFKKDEENVITELINKEIKRQQSKIAKQSTNNSQINNEKITIDIEKIKNLKDNFYYNKNYKAYSLELYYLSGNENIKNTAQYIKEKLENLGIKINIAEIKQKDLINLIKQNKEKYDILITGIDLEYFNANISKYFYSGQITKGVNFSKIKNSKLDNKLEILKSSLLTGKTKANLEKEIINIINSENIFKPLYTPYYFNLVSKNINGYELNGFLPKKIYRFDPLKKSYILKEKIVNNKEKSLIGFFKYLFGNLF